MIVLLLSNNDSESLSFNFEKIGDKDHLSFLLNLNSEYLHINLTPFE